MNKPLLRCEKLAKTFRDGKQSLSILSDIDFEITQQESIAIVGASGSGKSTFLQLLAGLDSLTAGAVFWENKNTQTLSESARCAWRNQHLGFVYQFHHLLPEFTALENVMMPLLIRGVSRVKALKTAQTCLAAVDLSARLNHKPATLSGGERQRVALARALAPKPSVILADEPTGNLDDANSEQVFELLLSLQQSMGLAMVVVTHDRALASRMQSCYALSSGGLHQDAS